MDMLASCQSQLDALTPVKAPAGEDVTIPHSSTTVTAADSDTSVSQANYSIPPTGSLPKLISRDASKSSATTDSQPPTTDTASTNAITNNQQQQVNKTTATSAENPPSSTLPSASEPLRLYEDLPSDQRIKRLDQATNDLIGKKNTVICTLL